MIQYPAYNKLKECFALEQQCLIEIIKTVAEPDAVYLLGGEIGSHVFESIFMERVTEKRKACCYYVLILIKDNNGMALHELQDTIEKRVAAKTTAELITIIMETKRFNTWKQNKHPFTEKILQKTVPVYCSEEICMNTNEYAASVQESKEAASSASAKRAEDYLFSAKICITQKQNIVAAFLLHQSMEQALTALLQKALGYYVRTHNLNRLIQLAALATDYIKELFPCNTEKEKRLFQLLQKAYSDGRYKEDYTIVQEDLLQLYQRVNKAVNFVITYNPSLSV